LRQWVLQDFPFFLEDGNVFERERVKGIDRKARTTIKFPVTASLQTALPLGGPQGGDYPSSPIKQLCK
jgi:hypothetical protein